MKKFILFLLAGALFSQSCEPLDEIYEELDRTASVGVAKVLSLDIDLTFENEDKAKDSIPHILNKLYPQLGHGSAVTVNYNLASSGFRSTSPYVNAEDYTLNKEDYSLISKKAGIVGYINNEANIPKLLDQQENFEAGDILGVTYNYSSVSYEEAGVPLFREGFETVSDLSDYQTVSIEGDQEWELYSSSSGYKAARMNVYSNGNVPNEDYLILPEIDLTGYSDAVLSLSHVVNFLDEGVLGEDLKVLVSTNYDGEDPSVANWMSLELNQWPLGNSYDMTESEASLSAFANEKIHIAFYFRSTTEYGPQWRINEISVTEGMIVNTSKINAFYKFDGSEWNLESGVYYLNQEDYDAMGAPGQYDNFSSSIPAENYIPRFLEMKYPYAQDEEEVLVIYNYYSSSSGLQKRGNLYTYLNGMWNSFKPSLQFSNEYGEWVPDNTVRYTLLPSDYTKIAENENLGTSAGRSNLASYGNFSESAWSNEQIRDAIGYILETNFPDSEEGQKYLVFYDTYPSGELQMILIKEGGQYILSEN